MALLRCGYYNTTVATYSCVALAQPYYLLFINKNKLLHFVDSGSVIISEENDNESTGRPIYVLPLFSSLDVRKKNNAIAEIYNFYLLQFFMLFEIGF